MSKKWVDVDVIFTDEYINNKYKCMMTEVPNRDKRKEQVDKKKKKRNKRRK